MRKSSRTKKNPPSKKSSSQNTSSVDERFTPVVNALTMNRDVSIGKMFGAVGLMCNGKVFAMTYKGKFVAKLPKERVTELIEKKGGAHFDPGHGKLMKEWVALNTHANIWIELANEAREYVNVSNKQKQIIRD
jgi:TfoX/Sxy family transcriptional regulator of competence genes